MDIYSYINSRDVATYCREIKKVWTPFEMAIIIGRSHRMIADKHKGWQELINNYPDMPTPENMHYKSYPSLHEKMKETVEYEERALAHFKTPEPGAVYRHMVMWHGNERHSDSIFTSVEKCLTDVRSSWEHDEVPGINMYKDYIDDDNSRIQVYMDYDGNPYWLSVYRDNNGCLSGVDFQISDGIGFFNDMFYIDIPIPFKRGDILTYSSNYYRRNDDVFVLDSTSRDDRIEKRLNGEMSDGTDMIGWGFYVSNNGVLYGDHSGGYDSFEYCRKKLAGNNRLLHYVSLFLKDKIVLPELLAMQLRIVAEELLENNFLIESHGCYIPESLLAENRLTPEEKEKVKQVNGLMP